MTELSSSSLENSKKFVPVREAAKRVSYTTDYVSRLAREGKIEAKREGRAWLVELDSLKLFSLQAKADAIRKQEELKLQRRLERAVAQIVSVPDEAKVHDQTHHHSALLQAASVTICLSLALLLLQVAVGYNFGLSDWQRGVAAVTKETQTALALDSFGGLKLPEWFWFFRYEKQETLVRAETAPSETENEILSRSHYPAQIDTTNDELLITAPQASPNYVRDTFSDDVLLKFQDSQRGTVTAEFVSGESKNYPFRLVRAPVNPITD